MPVLTGFCVLIVPKEPACTLLVAVNALASKTRKLLDLAFANMLLARHYRIKLPKFKNAMYVSGVSCLEAGLLGYLYLPVSTLKTLLVHKEQDVVVYYHNLRLTDLNPLQRQSRSAERVSYRIENCELVAALGLREDPFNAWQCRMSVDRCTFF